MLAIAALVRGHHWKSLALLLGGLLLHPLVPLAGLLFWLFYKSLLNRRWWLGFPAGIAALWGLAMAGVSPFASLLQAIDPDWLSIVKVRGDFCFEDMSAVWPWFVTIAFSGMAIAATWHLEEKQRRIIFISFGVLLIGRIINWLGTELAPNAFILGIQLYRTGWLFSILGSFAVGSAIVRSIETYDQGRRTIIALSAASLLTLWVGNQIPLMLVVSGVLFILLAACWLSDKTTVLGKRIWLAAYMTCALLAVHIVVRHVAAVRDFPDHSEKLLSNGIALAALALIFYAAASSRAIASRYRYYIRGLAVLLVIAAAWNLDHRTDYQKAVEARSDYDELRSLIEPGEPIYWEGDHMVPWHVLRQESYFSCQQGTGAIFSRELALDYAARYDVFKSIGPLEFGKYFSCPADDSFYLRARSRADLTQICEQAPRLRYLALRLPAQDDPGVVWRSKAPYQDVRILNNEVKVRQLDTVHIYDCRILVSQNQGG
jgi:hypothetical protein